MPHSLRSAGSLLQRCGATLLLLAGLMAAVPASALPLFARQTGQNCVVCHAGGQFPELTPYGRMFKMTGYTLGIRTLPLAVMAVASDVRVANTQRSDDPAADFDKNHEAIFATASVFVGGRITDNIGAFLQFTHDSYAGGSPYFHADNMDIRAADHLVDADRDLVYGLSVNNNPSLADPWNTAAAWMQYVPAPAPSAYQFIDANTPYPGFGAGGNLGGATAYLFWQRSVYLEAGSYRTANGALSFLSNGFDDANTTHLAGAWNPYWRLAWSHEWGAHNVMVGTSTMIAHVYDGGTGTPGTADPGNLGDFRNTDFALQYQYLSDPHALTVQAVLAHQRQRHSANTLAAYQPTWFPADGLTPVANPDAIDTLDIRRIKVSYVHAARVGGSVAWFDSSGNANTLNQTAGYDATGTLVSSSQVNGNLSGRPDQRGMTWEAFWMPIQYLRLGAQYTRYQRYNGASSNYSGSGRDASDNDSLFVYAWGAY